MIKHVGKHSDRKVAVIFKQVPDEEHMTLVVYPDLLPAEWETSIMRAIESPEGQAADDLGDILHRNLLPNGNPILESLHKEGMIKKIQANQVIMTPTPTSHVRLDELNSILNEMKQGEDAVRRLAELDKNAGMVDPRAQQVQEAAQGAQSVLDDSKIAQDLEQQAARMRTEAERLIAESDRLVSEAAELMGKPEPKKALKKRGRKPKAESSSETAKTSSS